MRSLVLTVILLATLPLHVLADAMKLEIIELKNRPASEIIHMIKPFMSQGATATGTGFRLIVRTTPENIAEIKQILNKLDTRPHQLMVSVKFADYSELNDSGIEAKGKIDIGDNNKGQVKIKIHKTASRDTDSGIFKARVLEGKIAHIRIGESIPVAERSTTIAGGVTTTSDNIKYKDITSGFFARPRISNDEVIVYISPEKNSLSPSGGGVVNTQTLITTVRGKLGEWMLLGGLADDSGQTGSGTVYSTSERQSRKKQMLLKVEKL